MAEPKRELIQTGLNQSVNDSNRSFTKPEEVERLKAVVREAKKHGVTLVWNPITKQMEPKK